MVRSRTPVGRGRTDLAKVVGWLTGGKLRIDPMIPHKLKLEDINRGVELMHAGESIRAVAVY